MKPFVFKKRLYFVEFGENIVRRTLLRRFSLFAGKSRFWVYRDKPFVFRYRVDYGNIADLKESRKLFAQPVKARRLYFDNAVFSYDIGYKAADLLLMAVLIRLKIVFEDAVDGFLAGSARLCSPLRTFDRA